MATGSFKTPCPSCEAGVLVKDRSLIGKKIDCPKCKYRFVVEDPKKAGVYTGKKADKADDDEVMDDLEEVEEDQPKKTAPGKKPAVAGVKAKADARTAAPTKAKPAAKKGADEEEDEDRPKKKGKKGGSNKLMLGLVLAGVGVVVLGVAGFLVLGKGDTKKKGGGTGVPPVVNRGNTGTQQSAKDTKKDTNPNPAPPVAPVSLSAAGPELTNLLPSQAQHVMHVFFKDIFETAFVADAAFQPGALDDDSFKQRLGFSARAIDDLIRAENYSNRWALTVVHLKEALNEKAVTDALGLQPAAGSPMNGQVFFKVTRNGPWLEQLARLSLGTMPPPRLPPAKGEDLPLLVRILDPQTLVFADVAPMQELLGRAKMSMGGGSATTYTTVKPALKTMLDKMEKTTPNSSDRVLYSAATDLDAARLDSGRPGRPEWHFRQVWDVAHALPENPQRLKVLGAAFVRRGKNDPPAYLYQNEIECGSDADAKTVRKDLQEGVAPDLVRFFAMLIGLKVLPPPPAVPPTVTPAPAPPAPAPMPPAKDANLSKITLATTDKDVLFTLDLVLDDRARNRLLGVIELAMYGLRGELELAAAVPHRHDLAEAGKRLGEQGIPDHGVPAGNFPYGVFKRAAAKHRSALEPGRRISWMAGLLPFLGQEALYSRIKFDASWKDPVNWMTARTLVPEFLDPAYPEWAHHAPYPGIPFPLGGTHFVGIAGIGHDAPDYAANDPAVVAKLGIVGYNRMTPLKDIKRGLDNTALMVQVPYDGPAGVTPWMAGGGSTVRGVPEKNSVKPFVSTSYNGKRGTFVLMANGAVRFVTEDVKDEVFQAMCTINGPGDLARLDQEAPVVKGPKKADVPSRPKEAVKNEPGIKPPAPASWQEYQSKDGGFSVMLPGTPVVANQKLPPDKGSLTVHVAVVSVPNEKKEFAAMFIAIPPDAKAFPLDQQFAMFREMTAGSVPGAKVKAEKEVKLGQYPGREFELEAPGEGTALLRIYIVDRRVYALMIGGPGVTATSPEVQRVFGSFKLLPGAK